MAIGERIRFIRNLRGMTQKWLGIQSGLTEKTADIRIAQYESGTRVPKEDLTEMLAKVLDVSPAALNVPDIESYIGVMHTLFALEDLYALKIDEIDGEPIIRLNKNAGEYSQMFKLLQLWAKEAAKRREGEISKEDYDDWRYNFPERDTSGLFHKVGISDKLNELLTEERMKNRK